MTSVLNMIAIGPPSVSIFNRDVYNTVYNNTRE